MLAHSLLLFGVLAAATATIAQAQGGFAAGAPRYWPKFGGSREVKLLDGQWDYNFIDWTTGFDSMSPTFKPSDATLDKKATVPSCSDVVAGGAAGFVKKPIIVCWLVALAFFEAGCTVDAFETRTARATGAAGIAVMAELMGTAIICVCGLYFLL